jgi:rod shape-determining protein MreD
MRWFLLILSGIAVLLAEVSLFDYLSIAGVRPNLTLALALLITMTSRRFDLVCLSAWLLGLMVDLLSGARFGVFSLLFLLSAMATYGLKRIVAGDTLVGQTLLIGGVVLVVNLAEGLWMLGTAQEIGVGIVAACAAGTALYTALTVPALGWLGKPVLVKFGKEAEPF